MRQFKIADRFGDNYSTAIARIMCDVKCLDYPSYTEYEDQVGEKEFWRFQDLDYSPENCWVDGDKGKIWSEGFLELYIDGYLTNSHAESYMHDHIHKVEYTYNLHDDDFENTFASIVRDYYVEEYDILPNSLIEFQVIITITPDEWTFEGRQAGYYSVMFDVDSGIYAKYLDEEGCEQEDDYTSIDDVWSDWLEDSWEELGDRYINDDEAFTKDIDDALNEYVDVCGREVANHIYFNSYYEEKNSNVDDTISI